MPDERARAGSGCAVPWSGVTDAHDRSGYREALGGFLAILGNRLVPPARFEDDADLWCAALLLRSQRLLANGLHLTERDGPSDGVGLLARSAFESAIVGAWLLGDHNRLNELQGELTRSHEIAVRDLRDHDLRDALDAALDIHRKHWPSSRRRPLEQVVNDVAEWVSESEPVLFHRLLAVGDQQREEPVPHDGEPYRSSYSAIYRTLSTYDVHGAGTVQQWIDLGSRTLRPEDASRPVVEPTEALVLVGAMVADLAARLLGYRPLRPAPGGWSEDHAQWEAGTTYVRAAARAIASDDPSEWTEFLYS